MSISSGSHCTVFCARTHKPPPLLLPDGCSYFASPENGMPLQFHRIVWDITIQPCLHKNHEIAAHTHSLFEG